MNDPFKAPRCEESIPCIPFPSLPFSSLLYLSFPFLSFLEQITDLIFASLHCPLVIVDQTLRIACVVIPSQNMTGNIAEATVAWRTQKKRFTYAPERIAKRLIWRFMIVKSFGGIHQTFPYLHTHIDLDLVEQKRSHCSFPFSTAT
jgi:hypothetical protein